MRERTNSEQSQNGESRAHVCFVRGKDDEAECD